MTSSSGVSFKLTRTEKRKLGENKLSEDDKDGEEKKDFVLSVEEKKIKSTHPKEEKELIIPLIIKNNWRSAKKTGQSENWHRERQDRLGEGIPDSLDALAAKEIIAEASSTNEQRQNDNSEMIVPLVMQNKVPDGYETDEKLDVSLRPSESSIEDYERVPVEAYGLAMLRGMGWKPGDPIGNKNRKCVKPIEVVLRPKGLGLGAIPKPVDSDKDLAKADEADLQLITGAYVCLEQGHQKGLYGQVQGLDEENARVVVKLTLSGSVVTVSELFVRVVGTKEFQKYGKILNREKYAEFKKKESGRSKDCKRSKHHKKERDRDTRLSHKPEKSHKKRHEDEKISKHGELSAQSSDILTEPPWIATQLRVRCIDKTYKNGKYFNTKLIVEDVLTPLSCICKTEDGKILEDIYQHMLETVVPRNETSYVMIVCGRYTGQVGRILKRDKTTYLADVQLLSDEQKIMKQNYNSICEYVGDVEHLE